MKFLSTMRFACFVLLLSAVAIAADTDSESDVNPRFRPTLNLHRLPSTIKITGRDLRETQEFQDVVNYLEDKVSPSDIEEMLNVLPEALEIEDVQEEDDLPMQRSVMDKIPWNKIVETVQKMAKSDSKFSKVLNLVNDPKFRELVKKTVNSHTLATFVKDVATHGFSWTEFLHLLLHALCSAATTIQHDRYSVGVCQVLQNL